MCECVCDTVILNDVSNIYLFFLVQKKIFQLFADIITQITCVGCCFKCVIKKFFFICIRIVREEARNDKTSRASGTNSY